VAGKVKRTIIWFIAVASTFSLLGAVIGFKAFENMDTYLEWPDDETH
jgi:hypothetical protein